MNSPTQSAFERVLTTLGHREPDRVPLFLLLTMHGARHLGLSIQEYFSRPEHVVEGQLRMRARYGHDCYYAFFHAALEHEAWGGEVLFREDGPPNAGEPIIRSPGQINRLEAPRVSDCAGLQRVLSAVESLKARSSGDAPIIGVVMSPFSVPIMQMGFESYLNLMHGEPELFDQLMLQNESFCVEWANAQLRAGATFICYFDPVSSSTLIPKSEFLKRGKEIALRVMRKVNGPMAIHFASGACLPILDELTQLGMAGIGVGSSENLAQLKAAAAGKVTLVGNLNGIEMRRWTPEQAEAQVKKAIAEAGPGGGFILSDSHGEIPWQVSESTLMAISEAVRNWGRYPLRWRDADAV